MTTVVHRPQGMTPEALSQAMHECNTQMCAWQSNINYRNVAFAG